MTEGHNEKLGVVYFGGIAVLLVLNLASAALIKYSPQVYHEPVWLGLLVLALGAVYAIRTGIWLVLGKHYQLTYVYPAMSINMVAAVYLGVLLFDETFSLQKTLGSIILTIGIVVVATSPHRHEPATRRQVS